MMCFVQLGLLIAGAMLIRKREIRMGGQVAPAPTPFFMGLVLILQMPIALMIGFALGVNAGFEFAKKNQGRQVSQAEITTHMQKFQKKYWWIDLAVPTAAAAVAGVLLSVGLRDPQTIKKAPSADPFAGSYDSEQDVSQRLRDKDDEF